MHAAASKQRDQEPFFNRGYAFEAPVWEYGGFKVVELTQVRARVRVRGRGLRMVHKVKHALIRTANTEEFQAVNAVVLTMPALTVWCQCLRVNQTTIIWNIIPSART